MDQTAPRSPQRRQFLRTAAGTTAGMASWLALGKPPAFAQKRELTFLSWNHFVPAADDELRKQAEAFAKANNCTVRVDTVAHLQLPAKIAAEAQSQSGHDMYRSAGADPFLYENLHANVDDVVDKLGKQYGGWYPFCAQMCQTAAGWKAVPWFWVSFPATYNMAHFKKAGFGDSYPKTWAELLSMGKVLKKQGNPVGIPISHCSDAHSTYWSVAWSYGAKVIEADGKTRHQLRQDRSGHRVVQGALQGRDGAGGPVLGRCRQQPLHPLRQGLVDPQSGQSVQRRPRRKRCPSPTISTTTIALQGRRARTRRRPRLSMAIWKFSKNQELAKEFIQFLFRKENYDAWIVASNAFNHPPLRHLADHPIWAKNPKFAMLPKEAEFAHPRGWPAKPSDAVQRIDDNYVMADMLAKSINGMPTKRAMEWAQDQVSRALKGQAEGQLDGRRAPGSGGGRLGGSRPPLAAARVVGAGGGFRLRPHPPCPRVLLVALVAFPFGMAIYFSLSDLLGGLAGRFRRARQLPRDPRQRDLPPDRAELLRLHRDRAHPQDRPRGLARGAPRPARALQAPDPRRRACSRS